MLRVVMLNVVVPLSDLRMRNKVLFRCRGFSGLLEVFISLFLVFNVFLD
jgi:hypothetical protein